MNCAGSAVSDDLFATKKETGVGGDSQSPAPSRQARQASETPAGVVRTSVEVQKAEEERRRQEEEAERQRQEEEEAERQRIAAEKRENSFWNKAIKGIKKFGKTIVEEED
jgi:cell division protein FtsA